MPTISLTLSAAAATRVQAALAEPLGKEAVDVTIADAKAYIVADLKQLVRSYEKREVQKTAEDGLTVPNIT